MWAGTVTQLASLPVKIKNKHNKLIPNPALPSTFYFSCLLLIVE